MAGTGDGAACEQGSGAACPQGSGAACAHGSGVACPHGGGGCCPLCENGCLGNPPGGVGTPIKPAPVCPGPVNGEAKQCPPQGPFPCGKACTGCSPPGGRKGGR